VTLLLAPQVGAQVTFYEQEGFRAGVHRIDSSQISPIRLQRSRVVAIVDRGQWEVCVDASSPAMRGSATRSIPLARRARSQQSISSTRRVKGAPAQAYSPRRPAPGQLSYYPRHGERLYTRTSSRFVRSWAREQRAGWSAAGERAASLTCRRCHRRHSGGVLAIRSAAAAQRRRDRVARSGAAVGATSIARHDLHAERAALQGGARIGAGGLLGRDYVFAAPPPRAARVQPDRRSPSMRGRAEV